MAYKGGIVERDLLRELNILLVNLEILNCPGASSLFNKLVWLESCGDHIVSEAYSHCPQVEVQAYADWLEVNCGKHGQRKKTKTVLS